MANAHSYSFPQAEILIRIGNVRSEIVCSSQRLINALRNVFKVENDIYTYRIRGNIVDNLRYEFLISKAGVFRTGLVDSIYKCLVKEMDVPKSNITLEDTRDFSEYPFFYMTQEEQLAYIREKLETFPAKLRPYQEKAVMIGLRKPRGTFEHATGAGKTMVASALIHILDTKTVIVCGKKDLARQLKSEFEEFLGIEVGLVGDKEFDIKKQVVVVLVAAAANKKISAQKKAALKELFESVRYVLCDETHHITAATWRDVVESMKNSVYRHGLTATFNTSRVSKATFRINFEGEKEPVPYKEAKDILYLIAYTGPIIDKVQIRELCSLGYLANPSVYSVAFSHNVNSHDISGRKFAEYYEEHIVSNEKRNFLVCSMIAKEYQMGSQVLVFVRQIEHGNKIIEMLCDSNGMFCIQSDEIEFAHGSDIDRKAKIKAFQSGNLRILIGSSIISEGLNFFCDAGINAAGGDSEIDVIQKLGRILRKSRPVGGDVSLDSKDVRFYDITDKDHPVFKKHAKFRLETYDKLGFPATPVLAKDFVLGID